MSTSAVNLGADSGPSIGGILAALSAPEPESAGGSQPSVDETPATAPETPAAETQPDQQEAAPPEQQEAQPDQPQQEETEEVNPYEADDQQPLPLSDILKTPRGREMYGGYTFTRDLTKALGRTPSIDETVAAFDSQFIQQRLESDISSGDPQRAQAAIGHLFGVDASGQPRANAHVVAAQLGPQLFRTNPQAFVALTDSVLNALPVLRSSTGSPAAQALYRKAEQPILQSLQADLLNNVAKSSDQAERDAYWFAASVLNHRLTGEYLKPPENGDVSQILQQVPPAQNDPLAPQRMQLAKEREAIQQHYRQQQAQAFQQREQYINSQIGTALPTEIDRALATLKSTASDDYYAYVQNDFLNFVAQQVPADPRAWAAIEEAKNRAIQTGNPADAEMALKKYMDRAQFVIRTARKDFLAKKAAALKSEADNKAAQLRQVQSNSAPASSGAPVAKQAPKPDLSRRPGEPEMAWLERTLSGA